MSETDLFRIYDAAKSLTVEILRVKWGEGMRADVQARLRAEMPGFHAEYELELAVRQIAEFRNSLRTMYKQLTGAVELKALEGGLEVKCEIDRAGHILWDICLWYPISFERAQLLLELHNDQTYLPPLIAQLDAILADYRPAG